MHRWLPAILLVALLAAFRILGSAFPEILPNLQPLPALLLCSVIFLKGTQRWILPAAVWLLTDPISSALQGYPLIGWHHAGIAAGLAATIGIALIVRRTPRAVPVLLSSAAAALAFYFLSNTVSFATDALYPKTPAGFVQAQWTGPIGFGPTWIFLRNLLAANVLFTGLFLLARHTLPATIAKPAPAFSR